MKSVREGQPSLMQTAERSLQIGCGGMASWEHRQDIAEAVIADAVFKDTVLTEHSRPHRYRFPIFTDTVFPESPRYTDYCSRPDGSPPGRGVAGGVMPADAATTAAVVSMPSLM